MNTEPSTELAAKPVAGNTAPSPGLFFDTINAYQKTAAIKAAIELDLFSPLADGPASPAMLAQRCQASVRGIRILCDYLTILGFLTKSGERYALTRDSAIFLNRASPAYAGGVLEFMLADPLTEMFDGLTAAVRKGGAVKSQSTVTADHPLWNAFARRMGPLMAHAAAGLAELVPLDSSRPTTVLDVSASHGVWGIAFAKKNPKAQLIALDWEPVLEISRQSARDAGVEDRFRTIAGSAFDVEFGSGLDVVLLPNFLHHFSPADCVRLLKKTHAALRPGGTVAIVDFVPNPDRVTPPTAAAFSLTMLATTPEGDAYTLAEYSEMLGQAGFKPPVAHPLPASMNVAVIATK